jgi:hypothetical protein
MLRATMFIEQHVIVICHIAGREDVRLRGFKVFIHHDAVLQLNSALE